MNFATCPNCSHRFSVGARIRQAPCPNCGTLVSPRIAAWARNNSVATIAIALLGVLVLAASVYGTIRGDSPSGGVQSAPATRTASGSGNNGRPAKHNGGGQNRHPERSFNSNPTGSAGDASAQLACTHWRNVESDIRAGILTDAEIRTKIQEVYNDAQYSDTPGIAQGAQNLLADVTIGAPSVRNVVNDYARFDRACSQAGF